MKNKILKLAVFLIAFNLLANANANISKQEMLQKGSMGLDGLAFVRPVIKGVLYRAGFKGGDKGHTGLSEKQRKNLCENGYSEARYIDFGTNTKFGITKCESNSELNYQSGSSSAPSKIMEDLYKIIMDKKNPMIVHCMWGVHSSGAVAAMALVQFCGWSEADAKKYWLDAENNSPCSGGCSNWINNKFKNFKFNSKLEIAHSIKQEICPPTPTN